jgi:outer membrane lipoprotein SlyB
MGCKGVVAFVWNLVIYVIGGAILGGILGGALAQAPGAGALLGAMALGILGAMALPGEIRKRQRLLDWYNRPFDK